MTKRPTFIMLVVLIVIGIYYVAVEIPRKDSIDDAAQESATFINFDPSSITRVTLTGGDSTIDLRIVGTHWEIVAPIQDIADVVPINTLMRAFTNAEVFRRIPAENLSGYHLDPPDFLVSFFDSSNTALASINVGSFTIDKHGAYAQLNDDHVLIASPGIRHYCDLAAEDFRHKKVAPFDLIAVNGYTLSGDHDRLTWTRTGDSWTTTSDGKIVRGDKTAVEAVLRRIRSLRVWSFPGPDEYSKALEKSDRWIEINRSQEIPTMRLTFTQIDSAMVVVQRSPDGRVVKSGFEMHKVFDESLQSLRDRHVLHFDADLVARVEISTNDTTATVVRHGEEWGSPNISLGLFPTRRVAALIGQMGSTTFDQLTNITGTSSQLIFSIALLDANDTMLDRCDFYVAGDRVVGTSTSTSGWMELEYSRLQAILDRVHLLRN